MSFENTIAVAAIQLASILGDVDANLAACERLVAAAAQRGARIIVLPEFFTSGMAFSPEVEAAAEPTYGRVSRFLQRMADQHNALVGGSFLARDDDGHVRNAFLLCDARGVLGRHDKDLPTMWENSLCVGGTDDGIIVARDGLRIGVAMCWELMRAQTVKRLAGRVDLVLSGSAWWSVPIWWPKFLMQYWKRKNGRNCELSQSGLARMLGVPVVHASHSGPLRCATPWAPAFRYVGEYEGPAAIWDGRGNALVRREASEGEGIVMANVEPGNGHASVDVPDVFWLYKRGLMPSIAWFYQRIHGQLWYGRHNPRPIALPRSTSRG